MLFSRLRAARGRERLTYVRLLGGIHGALRAAYAEEAKRSGLTLSALAGRVGRDEAFVASKMNGAEGMTLRTLARLAAALGRTVEIRLAPPPEAKDGSNLPAHPVVEADDEPQWRTLDEQPLTTTGEGVLSAKETSR